MPEVIFNGPEGRLAGRYHQGKTPNAPIAIVLHPHPQYGGTMNNKGVFEIFQALTKRGFSALRFNFRGVGRSSGAHDNGNAARDDVLALVQTFVAEAPMAKPS